MGKELSAKGTWNAVSDSEWQLVTVVLGADPDPGLCRHVARVYIKVPMRFGAPLSVLHMRHHRHREVELLTQSCSARTPWS